MDKIALNNPIFQPDEVTLTLHDDIGPQQVTGMPGRCDDESIGLLLAFFDADSGNPLYADTQLIIYRKSDNIVLDIIEHYDVTPIGCSETTVNKDEVIEMTVNFTATPIKQSKGDI